MPVHHALLALLEEGPSYGYELKATFEQAIGPQYGELNRGYVYQVLDRLERDGLVLRRRVAQAERPDKSVFELTSSGADELEAWLSSPLRRQAGYRDDLFLKLFVAARQGVERLQAVTASQRATYMGELASLGSLRAAHADDPMVSLLIEAARLHTEAALAVVELADSNATVIAEHSARPARSSTLQDSRAHPTSTTEQPHAARFRSRRPAVG